MPSISFVFRPSTRMGDYPGSLYIRIIHQRKIKTATIPGRLFPSEWDNSKQTIVYPENNPSRIVYLEEMEQRIRDAQKKAEELIQMLEKRGYYTWEEIIKQYQMQNNNGKLLSYTELLARGLEKNEQHRTANAYRTVARGLIKFNNGHDIFLSNINATLIKSFEIHLKHKGKFPNTISYYMRNLRSLYNKAVRDKQINVRRENPFADVFTGIKKTNKRALSVDEITKLYELDLKTKIKSLQTGSAEYIRFVNLYFAWRLFFFCFYTRGMCFVDMAYLKKSAIQDGLLKYFRRKTGQMIKVKVTQEMQCIMDSFSGMVECSEYIFPIILNNNGGGRTQYETAMRIQNRRLKELAKLAGINKSLTTHVARHSWATIGKQQNLPIGVISEGLGHASEKVTYSYLDSFNQSILDEANIIITKAIERKA